MDNVKRHMENVLLQPTSIADLPKSCENKYANEAINYLKQLNQVNSASVLYKKPLIKFNMLNKFNCCLSDINEKANNLRINGHANAAETADQLVNNLQIYALEYLKNPKNTAFETFKSQCFNHINVVKPVLEVHRGWKHLFINLTLAILGAGVLYIVVASINKRLNGKFTFFRNTDSIQKVNGIADEVSRLESIEKAMCSTPLSSRGS